MSNDYQDYPRTKEKFIAKQLKKMTPKKSVRMIERNLCWIFRKINKLIDEVVEEEDESVLARVGKFYSFLHFSFFIN